MADKNPAIEALLSENRRFKPDKNFTANANIKDAEIYERANADPEKFWHESNCLDFSSRAIFFEIY